MEISNAFALYGLSPIADQTGEEIKAANTGGAGQRGLASTFKSTLSIHLVVRAYVEEVQGAAG